MRRHANPEPEPAADPASQELKRTLNLLLPIRRQRLNRSERQQREQEQALRQLEQQTDEGLVQLSAQQQGYQQLKTAFARDNCGVRQASYRLERAVQKEQRALKDVQQQQLRLHALKQDHLEQQTRVEEAQQETRQRQREVEKLSYLLQQEMMND